MLPRAAWWALLLLLNLLLLPLAPAAAGSPADPVAPPTAATPGYLYLGETGHVVGLGFLMVWQQGGPGVYGYPLTEEFDERCEGVPCTVQYFERARFEYRPDTQAISLGLLGREYLGERGFPREEPGASTPDRWYMPETGQTLAYGFLNYWLTHDGLRLLGLPISPELSEDGRTVQYFERGRLDYFAEREPAARLEVAPLGRAVVERRGWELPATVELALSAETVAQGRPLALAVRGATTASAVLAGQAVALNASADTWRGMVGVAPSAEPGLRRLSVSLTAADGSPRRLERDIRVIPYDFPSERITVAPDLLAPGILERELAIVRPLYSIVTPEPLWQGPWIWPATGRITTEFATRRAYNDGPLGEHHGGVDIGAPTGTPVVAPASGRVVYAGPLAIRGNFIAIDHGLGVLSTYFHLSAIDVSAGQMVAAGERIGRVGSTGLSTGPHLHWEARVAGTPVDPRTWLTADLLP